MMRTQVNVSSLYYSNSKRKPLSAVGAAAIIGFRAVLRIYRTTMMSFNIIMHIYIYSKAPKLRPHMSCLYFCPVSLLCNVMRYQRQRQP
jgi:hypothetical protein